MKKLLLSFFAFLSILSYSPTTYAGRGGSSFAGGMAGGMLGGMIGGAMTKDSGRARRAEEEARRAQDQTEDLRREQQQEKYLALQHGMYQQKTGFTTTILLIALFILFLAVVGLGFMIFKMKNKKE